MLYCSGRRGGCHACFHARRRAHRDRYTWTIDKYPPNSEEVTNLCLHIWQSYVVGLQELRAGVLLDTHTRMQTLRVRDCTAASSLSHVLLREYFRAIFYLLSTTIGERKINAGFGELEKTCRYTHALLRTYMCCFFG